MNRIAFVVLLRVSLACRLLVAADSEATNPTVNKSDTLEKRFSLRELLMYSYGDGMSEGSPSALQELRIRQDSAEQIIKYAELRNPATDATFISLGFRALGEVVDLDSMQQERVLGLIQGAWSRVKTASDGKLENVDRAMINGGAAYLAGRSSVKGDELLIEMIEHADPEFGNQPIRYGPLPLGEIVKHPTSERLLALKTLHARFLFEFPGAEQTTAFRRLSAAINTVQERLEAKQIGSPIDSKRVWPPKRDIISKVLREEENGSDPTNSSVFARSGGDRAVKRLGWKGWTSVTLVLAICSLWSFRHLRNRRKLGSGSKS